MLYPPQKRYHNYNMLFYHKGLSLQDWLLKGRYKGFLRLQGQMVPTLQSGRGNSASLQFSAKMITCRGSTKKILRLHACGLHCVHPPHTWCAPGAEPCLQWLSLHTLRTRRTCPPGCLNLSAPAGLEEYRQKTDTIIMSPKVRVFNRQLQLCMCKPVAIPSNKERTLTGFLFSAATGGYNLAGSCEKVWRKKS